MNNFKISTRLVILIGILSVLLLAIGSLGLFGISQSNDALKTVYEVRTVATAQLSDIARLQLRNRVVIANTIINPVPKEIARYAAMVEANTAAISKVWDAYMAITLTPEEARIAKKYEADRAKYVQEGLIPAVAALRANDMDGAKRIMREKLQPLFALLDGGITALQKLQLDVAHAEYGTAVTRYNTIRMVSIGAILGGVLFAVLFGLAMIRGISRALRQAMDAASAVAQGDLTYPIRVEGKDEVAQLLTSLLAMQSSLVNIVGQVRVGTDTIATASGQIAAGNLDLSSRTEQQASSLEETAASMEELTSTVKQNADNAHQANALALSASQVAEKGGAVVAQVVDTMASINDSSKKINDIIGVIDGIAFQTNILALNAAVEAARAGEQGRGFAVVATEVRNLAQRSASAAKEIKALISGSVDKVDQGAKLVDQAGVTMEEIVASIRRVTDIMGEISAAGREQTAGIEQVNQAISQMDQVTQQNAALVEEAAAAAASMQDQAGNLVQVVSVFKIEGTYAAIGAPLKAASRPTPVAASVPNAAGMRNARRPAVIVNPPKRVANAPATADNEWEEF